MGNLIPLLRFLAYYQLAIDGEEEHKKQDVEKEEEVPNEGQEAAQPE